MALWRLSSRTLAFRLLPLDGDLHPAEILPHSTDPNSDLITSYTGRLKSALTDLVLDMVKVDDDLKMQDPAYVKKSMHGWALAYLPQMEALLKDELAAPLWLRIKRKLWKMCLIGLSQFDG